MALGTSAVEFIGISVLVVLTVVLASRIRDRWMDDLDEEFQAALSGLGIERWTFIINRVVTPSGDRTAEVYRIFHDPDDRYFLFMKTAETPGVLKPLTKERALLAAKMSGYKQCVLKPDTSLSREEAIRSNADSSEDWEARTDIDLRTVEPAVSPCFRSSSHAVLVRLCLYLVVWPNVILTSLFTLLAIIVPPALILMLVAWWGLGSLFALYRAFAGKYQNPGKFVWWGLIASSGLVLLFGIGGGLDRVSSPSVYWLQAMCVPVAVYWVWLVRRGFRL